MSEQRTEPAMPEEKTDANRGEGVEGGARRGGEPREGSDPSAPAIESRRESPSYEMARGKELGSALERAAIVNWLRSFEPFSGTDARVVANDIERGLHHRGPFHMATPVRCVAEEPK